MESPDDFSEGSYTVISEAIFGRNFEGISGRIYKRIPRQFCDSIPEVVFKGNFGDIWNKNVKFFINPWKKSEGILIRMDPV